MKWCPDFYHGWTKRSCGQIVKISVCTCFLVFSILPLIDKKGNILVGAHSLRANAHEEVFFSRQIRSQDILPGEFALKVSASTRMSPCVFFWWSCPLQGFHIEHILRLYICSVRYNSGKLATRLLNTYFRAFSDLLSWGSLGPPLPQVTNG